MVGAEVDGAEPPLAIVAADHHGGPSRDEIEQVAVFRLVVLESFAAHEPPALVRRKLGQVVGIEFHLH